MALAFTDNLSSALFIIDSGATVNVVNSKDALINYTTTTTSTSCAKYIRCAGGTRLAIVGHGDLANGLGRALFVPQATRNLLSVSQLTAAGQTLSFSKDKVCLDGTPIGSLEDKLYVLRSTVPTVDVNTASTTVNDAAVDDILIANDVLTSEEEDTEQRFDFNLRRDIDLLHRRFAHTDVNMIYAMLRYNSVDGLRIPAHVASPHRFHCEACALCKATTVARDPKFKQPRDLGRVQKDLYFRVVWTDVLGPVQPVALGGYHYGVTFTEESSRYRYFFALKSKDEVFGVFQQLVAEVSALGFSVRQLRSDNGGEYTSKEFKAFCTLNNITQ